MPRYARAVLGGTFDRLHVGHEALLATAFRLGRTVAIGLTTEAYLAAHPKPGARGIAPYRRRREALSRWLRRRFPGRSFSIVPLEDRFGGSVGPHVSLLVVSADTLGGGSAVNRERVRRGRRPVPVAIVPIVRADDLAPVSSRRIRSGEVDRNGRLRVRVPLELWVNDPAAFPWATRAVRSALPRVRLTRRVVAITGPTARRPPPSGIRLEVVRGRRGWRALASTRHDTGRARNLSGRSPRDLERELRAFLRPEDGRLDPTT